jgi:PAS domain S-box-containing protein
MQSSSCHRFHGEGVQLSAAQSTGEPPAADKETRRLVLLVDDDVLQLKLGCLRLRQAGFEVEPASGAEEAWAKIGQRRPDAIVSDVLMAEVDGFAFCKRVRDEPNLSAVPVILLSAHYCGERDRELAQRVGASALLARTSDFETEISVLRTALTAECRSDGKATDAHLDEEHLRVNANQLARLVDQARDVNERYRALFNNANDAIALLSPEGFVLEANCRWGELLNVTPESLVGWHIRDFSPPGHEVANTDEYLQSVGKGTSQNVAPIRRASGAPLFMEFSTSVVDVHGERMVFAIGRDVTERVHAARALAAAEEKYRLLLERIPDAIWIANPSGQVTFVSPNVVRMLGFTAEEVCSEDWATRAERIHPEDRPRVREEFRELVRTGKPLDIEYRRQRKDGRWIWVRNRATATFARDGVHYTEGMLTDVTEKRKLEEQLRHAQKMEAVGRLAGGVAHDFNNMLNVLLGYTVMLLEDVPSTDPMHEPLMEMKRAGERSADLTRQLLAFSRQQPHAPQVLSLNEVVASVDKFTRRLVGEDIEVVTLLASDLPDIKADPGQIEQVIMNIIVNARDAMPDGGKLTIETSVEQCDEYVASYDEVKRGRYVMVAVSDAGMGMDKETQTRIFEPFFTTKEVGKGTGLGLSIVFGIVHQCGGHIFVYSELGKGTTFKLYFPVAVGNRDSAAAPPPLAASTRGSETILLVEDEEQVRTFVETVLQRQGYRVLTARHPAEAVLLAEQHPAAIDLLLTDVIMPQATGRQLADQLLPRWPNMKVIYISGYTSTVVLDHGVPEGVAFLQKPVLPEILTQKVRAVLDAAFTKESHHGARA